MSRSAKRVYHNEKLAVYWDAALCTHAGICFTEMPRVFNPRKRPWINLDGANAEMVVEVVNACPTRALTFRWSDPEVNEQETSPKLRTSGELELDKRDMANGTLENKEIVPAKFKVMRNGPIVVTGDFIVLDSEGKQFKDMKMISLCRCGSSHEFPFCDGRHFNVQFYDDY